MTENHDTGTPPPERSAPDDVETDPAALSSSEDLDEDQLKVDPLEEGTEPPERWVGADKFGTTPFEEQQGETLEQRVQQERPDRAALQEDGRDEPVGEEVVEGDRLAADEQADDARSPAERHDQAADQAGGSVASSLRDPEEGEDVS